MSFVRCFRGALLIFILTVSAASAADDYKGLVTQALEAYMKKDHVASVAAFKAAFALNAPGRADLYNAACVAALTGDAALAMEWLQLSVEKGYSDVSHLSKDADLASLRGLEAWPGLVARVQKNLDAKEAGYDKALQAELLVIYEDDQALRKQLPEMEKTHGRDSQQMQDLWKTISVKDAENLIKVEAILEKRGWVGPETVGAQANSALFLVIQHAPLATQQKYLPMMREAVKTKKARGSSLALLEDRVALREGRKQIYGSQIGINPTTGGYYVQPLEDPERVDERRSQMGMPPLADYVKQWKITWDPKAYKDQLPELEALAPAK